MDNHKIQPLHTLKREIAVETLRRSPGNPQETRYCVTAELTTGRSKDECEERLS